MKTKELFKKMYAIDGLYDSMSAVIDDGQQNDRSNLISILEYRIEIGQTKDPDNYNYFTRSEMTKMRKLLFEAKNNNHGGKRAGAGRPKGTTGAYKTETKKMHSFRLSKIEHEAVKNLLNEMRKKN